MVFKLLPELKQDFIEICGREKLDPQTQLNLLIFLWLTNQDCPQGVKTVSTVAETLEKLKLCYGDVL